jgi:hypothetical protein
MLFTMNSDSLNSFVMTSVSVIAATADVVGRSMALQRRLAA